MKKHFIAFVIPLLPLSAALADDCEVDASSRVVSCATDGTFDPSEHGGQSLYEVFRSSNPSINPPQTAVVNGWNFIYGTTAAQSHALAQFSDTLLINSLSLTTTGDQADALIVRNFDPTVDVNVFNAQTSGLSADGINVAREAQNGRVTVYEQLRVNSQQGLGIRANIAHYDYPTHNAIVVKGTSEIDTFASGSDQTGHAVLAGTNLACGPLNLPLFECRVIADAGASIDLLGDSNTIRTRGQGAAGLFAKAKGVIRAGNVDISSSGNAAFGVRANRLSGTWYFNQSTQGRYDYAGTVELLGNVAVTTTGVGAFAFHADSLNATGVDSLGITASIRSFDSASGQAVTHGIYTVRGDMLARNSGIIDLTMANQSQFTGTTAVASQGVIRLAINGPDSRWAMTGSSSLSSLSLAEGATLAPTNGTASALDFSLTGTLSNAGVIDLASGSAGDRLRLSPNYQSSNGVLRLETCLGDSDSPTDQLIVNGDTQGTTRLQISPVAGANCAGAATSGNGILVVQVTGNSAGAFELEPPTIQAGNFVYTLVQQQNNWYLVSEERTAFSIENKEFSINVNQSASFNLLEANGLSASEYVLNPTTLNAANGVLQCQSNGACTYSPNSGFSGVDSFSYTICEIGSTPPNCNTATVEITVSQTTPPGPDPDPEPTPTVITPVPVGATWTLLGLSGMMLALLWWQTPRRGTPRDRWLRANKKVADQLNKPDTMHMH